MEKSYLKSLIDEVSAIEVKSEAQQIAKYELIEYVDELQDRINKAIEHIKDKTKTIPLEDGGGLELLDYNITELLEILGDNNE